MANNDRPPATQDEVLDEQCFQMHQRLQKENPFLLTSFIQRHGARVFRAQQRHAQNETGAARAVAPRHPIESLRFFK